MRVFICTDHDQHWPVGAASVVIASDEDQARDLLAAELDSRGLDGQKTFTLEEIDLEQSNAHILCDGNY